MDFKDSLLYDMLAYFGLDANVIKENANKRFVSDQMLMTLGGIPSVTMEQMTAMKPLGKILVNNVDDGAFYYWDGYEWKNLSTTLALNSAEINNLLKNAVLKIEGYGLSKNDFSGSMIAPCRSN